MRPRAGAAWGNHTAARSRPWRRYPAGINQGQIVHERGTAQGFALWLGVTVVAVRTPFCSTVAARPTRPATSGGIEARVRLSWSPQCSVSRTSDGLLPLSATAELTVGSDC